VYVIEKYGINSPCKFLDKNSVSYYKKELDKLKMQNSNLKAPNIILPDTLKNTQNLHEFAKQYDFTVLIFYAPSCEHCQKEIPIMEETITNLEKQFNKRIGRFAICNDLDSNDEDWSKFIRTHKLNTNYAHVNLPKESKLRELYDAFSTPIYFLIDSDSDFLARRISPVSIKRYFLTL
jgi:thiol-disulfide isomerase/thioredoxin